MDAEPFTSVWKRPTPILQHPQNVPFNMASVDPFLSSQGESLLFPASRSSRVTYDRAGYNAISNALTIKGDPDADLYRLMARMTLNSTLPAAMAVRHALTAVSFQFLGERLRAREHQNQALGAIRTTISKPLPLERMEAFQAMAASMLLNIYEASCSLSVHSAVVR